MKPFFFVALGLLLSVPLHAEEGPPLKKWKNVMDMAEQQNRAGRHDYACRHATNLAHFMNEENYELQQRQAPQKMIQDLRQLEIDWQTYVGKYCSYQPPIQRSGFWDTLNGL